MGSESLRSRFARVAGAAALLVTAAHEPARVASAQAETPVHRQLLHLQQQIVNFVATYRSLNKDKLSEEKQPSPLVQRYTPSLNNGK